MDKKVLKEKIKSQCGMIIYQPLMCFLNFFIAQS